MPNVPRAVVRFAPKWRDPCQYNFCARWRGLKQHRTVQYSMYALNNTAQHRIDSRSTFQSPLSISKVPHTVASFATRPNRHLLLDCLKQLHSSTFHRNISAGSQTRGDLTTGALPRGQPPLQQARPQPGSSRGTVRPAACAALPALAARKEPAHGTGGRPRRTRRSRWGWRGAGVPIVGFGGPHRWAGW